MNQKRVLPAAVYDTVELTSLAFGGIGAGTYRTAAGECGYCVIGQAYDAEDWGTAELSHTLRMHGINEGTNDRAVRAINSRRHTAREARVPFEEWAKELGVERGK